MCQYSVESRMTWQVTRRTFVGRDVMIAFGVLVALELVMAATSVRVLQIPGYVILFVYEYAQNLWLPGLNTAGYIVGFALYVYALAFIIATLYRGFQNATRHEESPHD